MRWYCLCSRKQLGLRPQHLVLGHLAVAEQGIVDAQVLGKQRAARLDDGDAADGTQPVDVAYGDVATQTLPERSACELAGFEQRSPGANRRRNGRGNAMSRSRFQRSRAMP